MTRPDPLSNVLARWQPRPGPAPDFAATVYARINTSAPTVEPTTLLGRLLAWPASLPLAAAFAVIIGIGSALGLSRSHHQNFMADAYARSIDPIRLATTDDHAGHNH